MRQKNAAGEGRPTRRVEAATTMTSVRRDASIREDPREFSSPRRDALRSEKRDRFRANASSSNSKKGWLYVGVPVIIIVVVGILWAMTDSGGGGNAVASTKPGDAVRRSSNIFTTVTPENGLVKFSAAEMQDGKARYYIYKAAGGKEIDFFVMKSSDGVIRAAIDSCDVCFSFRKGYHQEGNEMVCNNCGQRFPSVKINEVKGGCNPAPLTRSTEGDTVTINEKDILADGSQYF
ncbi:MAG: DUF2318 domain-containing protein [Dehalococcoidia bacterium]|nr:DUF2318 domain-containing protein [Dehalococcoidia bacterium]